MQLAPADDDPIHSPGDLLVDGGVGGQRLARLVHVGQLDRGPGGQAAGIGLLLADDHPEQGRLAGSVGPDDAHDAARGKGERQAVHQQVVAERLHDAGGVHDLVPQAWTGRDGQLDLVGAPLGGLGLGHELVVGA